MSVEQHLNDALEDMNKIPRIVFTLEDIKNSPVFPPVVENSDILNEVAEIKRLLYRAINIIQTRNKK